MADEQIGIEIQDKVDGQVITKIERIATASRAGYDAVERLKTALASIDTRAVEAITAAQSRAQRSLDASALASQRLATEQQRTVIAATSASAAQNRLAASTSQAQAAAQRLATAQQQTAAATANAAAAASRAATAQSQAALAALRLANAQQQVSNATSNYIRNIVTLLATGFGIREILGAADAYTTLQNKLQVVSTTIGQVANLTQQLFDVANRTRAPVEETATAFSRFDRALMQLGRSQEESLRLTETVNKMLVISGSTAGEAGAALLQLSQAFNKGKLDGDEFRTVMELMPSAADAIAKELKVTRGELLLLAPQGKITAEVMARAFGKASAEVDATFGKTIPTLSQSMTVFRNNFIQSIGQFDKATGITKTLSALLIVLSENMRALGVAVTTVGAALLLYFGPALAASLTTAARAALAFGAALFANPIGVVVLALTALVSYLVLFRDKSDLAKEAVENLGFALDAIVGTFRAIGIFIGSFSAQLVNGFKIAYNEILDMVEDITNTAIRGVNVVREKLGKDPIELVHFDKATESTEFKSAGELWADSLQQGFDAQGGAISKFLSGTKSQLEEVSVTARKIAVTTQPDKNAEKRAAALAKVNLQLDNELQRLFQLEPLREAQARFDQIEETLAGKKIKLNAEEAASIRSKIDAIQKATQVQAEMDRIYEAGVGPLRDYKNTLEAADMLLKRGAISQETYKRAVFGATEAYKDSLDPLRQVNKEIDDQNKLLQFMGPQLAVEQQLQQIVNEQLQKNIELLPEQIQLLRERLMEQQESILQQQAESEVYDASVGALERYYRQLDAINKLKQNGTLTKGDAAKQVIEANPDFNLDLTQTGIDARLQQYDDMYARIEALRQKDLINEQTAAALRVQVWAKQQEDQLAGASQFFGYLSQLQKSENTKIAAVGKAAAITKAIIDTYTAANSAYAAMASIPYVGPALGAAAAAAAIIAGMANVNAIRSQSSGGFKAGGYTGNMGVNEVAGPVHGQEYVMDAAATRRIGVQNLDAMRRGASGVQGTPKTPNWQQMAEAPQVNIGGPTVVVVKDPNEIPTAIRSPAGSQAMIVAIGENAGEIRQVLGIT